MGDVKAVSDTDFDVIAIIRDITTQDRKIHEMGLAVTGNSKFYFKPSYTISETEYEVKEGDIITDLDSRKWRVVKILKQAYLPNQEIYRTAIIKNINLND